MFSPKPRRTMRILTDAAAVVMFSICACVASSEITDHDGKDRIVEFVKESLTDFFAFRDKYLRLLRQPEPEGLEELVVSMEKQNKNIEKVTMQLFNNKDAFMNSGRFDEFVKLKELRPHFKQVTDILKTLQKEMLSIHSYSGTHKRIYMFVPFEEDKSWEEAFSTQQMVYDVVEDYETVLNVVRNFLEMNKDVFDKDQVAEFINEFNQIGHKTVKMEEILYEKMDKKYALNPLLQQLIEHLFHLSLHLSAEITYINGETMLFRDTDYSSSEEIQIKKMGKKQITRWATGV